ncbi:hypothetical protein N7535_008028 [Penicillium sp. DV-2018c]|nr:hypothetical protein N7461_004063 [Penicillium sp. DV-2018c]KAJ5566390.1 hypothetical protein N7535_008028 [Penicillium sp. DV-2018c]
MIHTEQMIIDDTAAAVLFGDDSRLGQKTPLLEEPRLGELKKDFLEYFYDIDSDQRGARNSTLRA